MFYHTEQELLAEGKFHILVFRSESRSQLLFSGSETESFTDPDERRSEVARGHTQAEQHGRSERRQVARQHPVNHQARGAVSECEAAGAKLLRDTWPEPVAAMGSGATWRISARTKRAASTLRGGLHQRRGA